MPSNFREYIRNPFAVAGTLIVLIALGVTGYLVLSSGKPSYSFALAAPTDLTETVSADGLVSAGQNVALAFQLGGTIASVPAVVGEKVATGQLLASLQSSTLSAQLAEAQAEAAAASANLAELTAGATPQVIALDQAKVAGAESSLTAALSSSYADADDAVRDEGDQMFSNPSSPSPSFNLQIPDSSLAQRVVNERVAVESDLIAWQSSLASTSDILSEAAADQSYLASVTAFMNDLSLAANTAVGVNGSGNAAALIASYRTAVLAARDSVNGASSALAAAVSAVTESQASLALDQAGATTDQLAAAQASLEAANASAAALQAQIDQSSIAAPFNATVAEVDAKVGVVASPGVPLITLDSNGVAEVDVYLSEIDAAKVKSGDVTAVTLDAYGAGTIFSAKVASIDPAATTDPTTGEAAYRAVVLFDSADPRIEPGMHATLSIIVASAQNALAVPQSAVITNGTSTSVEVERGGAVVEIPVTLGIEGDGGGQSALVQVVSGLSAGDQVVTFGN